MNRQRNPDPPPPANNAVTRLPLHYLLAYPQWRTLSDALYDLSYTSEQNKERVLSTVSSRFWHFFHQLKSFDEFSWLVHHCVDNKPVPTELTQIKLIHDATMAVEMLLVPGQIPTPLIDYQGQSGLYYSLLGSVSISQYMDQQVEISRHYAISKLRRVRNLELHTQELFPIEQSTGNIHELQGSGDCSMLLRIRLQCEPATRYWMFPITPKRLDDDSFFVRRVPRSD